MDNPNATTLDDIMNSNFSVIERKIEDDPDTEALLERIWQVYGSRTAIQLSNMSHKPDGAWYKAYHDLANGRRGVDISDALIKEEFLAKKGNRGAGSEHANS